MYIYIYAFISKEILRKGKLQTQEADQWLAEPGVEVGLSAEGTLGVFLAECSPNWTGDVVLESFFAVLGISSFSLMGWPYNRMPDGHKSAVEFFSCRKQIDIISFFFKYFIKLYTQNDSMFVN